MSTEAPFSFTTKSSSGDLFTVRGDSFEQFTNNLMAASAVPTIMQLLTSLTNAAPATLDQAVQNVVTAIPGSTVVEHNVPAAPAFSPAPAFAPVAPVAPVAPPQAAAPAGEGKNCQHGPMVLKPAGISQKTGKPYTAFWACQWPDRATQCKAVSA